MHEELEAYLQSLSRDESYDVEAILKSNPLETTEVVRLKAASPDNGNSRACGPYIRKRISRESGFGKAYKRIWDEQQSGKALPHIPRLFDYYQTDTHHVVVMEYVEGETLADVVYRLDPSVELACDVFEKLCEAIATLHTAFDPPLIHRDLKPSNIILSNEGLTIIDFGIARTFKSGVDRDTVHFGTRSYAPPEQFRYGQTSERSDIYAMGMILYYCLTEKTPDTAARESGFPDEAIPDPLRRIIVKATAFDPAARYASVTEMQIDFERARLGLSNIPAGATAQPDKKCVTPLAPPAMPPSAASSTQPVSPTSRPSLLARIPPGLGMAWNILVLTAWLIFIIGTIVNIVDPGNGSFSNLSLVGRCIDGIGIFFVGMGFIVYLVLDKRSFRSRSPRFPHPPLWMEAVICVPGFFLCGIVSTVIAETFFGI